MNLRVEDMLFRSVRAPSYQDYLWFSWVIKYTKPNPNPNPNPSHNGLTLKSRKDRKKETRKIIEKGFEPVVRSVKTHPHAQPSAYMHGLCCIVDHRDYKRIESAS